MTKKSFNAETFTVRFTKLLTNGFQSSLRNRQFHYIVVNFHAEFRWEVAKFVPFGVASLII